jgi:ABC-2 type transport system permease protein/oleandomycin transport system permease protein
MSTTSLSVPPTRPVPGAGETAYAPGRVGARRVLSHTAAITWRNLMQIPRNPQLLVFMVIQPIMFVVLFAYVFGGAITTPGLDYIDFLIPGILVQTVAFGTTATSVGLSEDLSKGLIDRFRSLPMARSAVLAGRVAADTIRTTATAVIIVGVGYLLGFDFHAGPVPAVGMIALAVAFGMAMSWIAALVGLSVRNPEAAQSAGFIWIFPLTFASSVFVPTGSMPGWLQAFADANPITIVADALRALALGGPTATVTWQAVAWIAGITAVFAPLAIRAYRRAG